MRLILVPLIALQASAALALTAGQSITPVLERVVNAGGGTFTAWFGYLNNNETNITIPVGDSNHFSDVLNRGQETSFAPGRKQSAFAVVFDGSAITWTLTGPDGKARSATASRTDAPQPGAADLNLKGKTTPSGQPNRSWVVFELLNETPGSTALDVRVAFTIAPGLSLISSSTDVGTVSAAGNQLTWTVGSFNSGSWKSVRLLVENSDSSPKEIRGTTTLGAGDPDGSDNSASVIVGGQASSGATGGLESNGRLTLLLARRGMLKRLGRKAETRLLAEGYKSGIEALVPSTAPDGSTALEVSPRDLIGVTNASGVYAVDYVGDGGRRNGAILGIATESTTYEHTKVTCDRLAGATLEELRQVVIGDIPFVLARLRRLDGTFDYAISFAMSAASYPSVIDSRWDMSRDPRFAGQQIYNFQVWAANADLTVELVRGILERAPRPISEDVTLELPAVWVKTGEYRNGKLRLELERLDSSVAQVTVAGKLTKVEGGAKEDYSSTLPFSPSLEIETGPIFDISFELGSDRLYLSDGAWSYWSQAEHGVITDFVVRPQVAAAGERAVERGVQVQGAVKDYVNIFRHLRPGSRPVDLTALDFLEVTVSGQGTLEIVPQRTGVGQFADQSRWKVELTPESKTHRLHFADLGESFQANDISTIFFNPLGNGETEAPFELTIDSLSFGQDVFNQTSEF